MSIGWNYYTPVSKGDLYIPCLLSYQSLPDNQGYILLVGISKGGISSKVGTLDKGIS